MTRTKLSLTVAVVSLFATSGALFLAGRSRAAEIARLKAANDRLRFEIAQRHHDDPPAPPTPSSGDAPEPGAAGREHSAPSPRREADDYRNEGTATPAAALQTFAWAGDRGDAERVQQMIVFDAPARAKAAAYLATLPAAVRAKWTTPEQLAAIELTHALIEHPFPRAGLLDRARIEATGEDRVVVQMPGAVRDGTQFQRTPEGWKYVVTEAQVDAYLARVVQAAPRPR